MKTPGLTSGFTLVEILVAVTIMLIVGFVGVGSYRSLEKQSGEKMVKARIDSLVSAWDREVAKWEITAYRAYFRQDAKGVILDTNWYGIKNPMEVSAYSWQTGIGTLSFTWLSDPGYRLFMDGNAYATMMGTGSSMNFVFTWGTIGHVQSVRTFDGNTERNTLRFLSFEDDANIPFSQRTTSSFEPEAYTGAILSNTRGTKSLATLTGAILTGATIVLTRAGGTFEYTLAPWK